MEKIKLKKALNLVIVASLVLGSSVLDGCKKDPVKANVTPSLAPVEQEPEVVPGQDPNDPSVSEMPQEPTDTPEPLPAPTKPIQANSGQPIAIKAIAKTTYFVSPVGNVKGSYINVELTWQPVIGAKEYWLYKTLLPSKEQVVKGSAYKVVNAEGFLSTLFMDGLLPPTFSGGNIWDKIKKGYSAISLRPGEEYKYKVFAVDADGNVIGESDAATTVPLPPIEAPINLSYAETETVKPVFKWGFSEGGTVPDGVFVSVHPPIPFGQQAATQSGSFGYAYWSTFRLPKTNIARYGEQSENAVSYPGTLPFNITFPLRAGSRYSFSVTAVKTDTNDMRTARAISKAWSDSKIFTIGPTTTNPTNSTGGSSASSGTSSSSTDSTETCNWWCKTKKLASSLVN